MAELMYTNELRRSAASDDLAERKLCLEEQRQKIAEEALALEVAKFNTRHEKY